MIQEAKAEIRGCHKRQEQTEEYSETYEGELRQIHDVLWARLHAQAPADPASLLMKIGTNRIEIRRSGPVKAEYLFEPGGSWLTVYQTPYGTFHFRILTQELEVIKKQDGWEVKVRYLMKDASVKPEPLLSESTLHIIIEPQNEAGNR